MQIYRVGLCLAAVCAPFASAQSLANVWGGYAHDAQHTGVSAVASQPLNRVKWTTPVDTVLQGTPGDLLIHYGSPMITAANTVLAPQRTGANSYQVNAWNGATGAALYSLSTDYTPPPHNWIPSYSPTLALGTRLYYPGAGGTVYYRNSPDSPTGSSGQLAFYGLATYQANAAALNSTVMISTPITADRFGNIYFGFVVTGSNPAGLSSGLARISVSGVGSWVSATALAGGDGSIRQVAMNCAPAVNAAGTIVYIAVSSGNFGSGYLASANASTLAPIARIRAIDPSTGQNATFPDDGSASPTIGPEGDVYYGVFEAQCCTNRARGWLLHFNSALTISKLPGAFGWDTTASIVARNLVPGYQGTSSYLLLTKYNNYKQTGGGGLNYVAVIDPNTSMTDPVTGASVMNVVIEQLGLTPDGPPVGAVREWCINSAAIDPVTKSAIVNSEDGMNYRWDFTTNTISQAIYLTPGVGEAYTPTVIGPDGTVYAINDGTLFAIGQ